jgi:hypothetical protein
MNIRIYGISLFAVLFISALGQASPTVSSQPPLVSLCTLLAKPREFAGKEVKIKAILASNSEYQSLRDDSCPTVRNAASGKQEIVEVVFTEDETGATSDANKRLSHLLKKDGEAQVTVAGVFVDPEQDIGHLACCRYQLKVRKVLSVASASHNKHGK